MLRFHTPSSSFSSCSDVHRKLKAQRKPAPPFLGSRGQQLALPHCPEGSALAWAHLALKGMGRDGFN